jgi:hypothetical protein
MRKRGASSEKRGRDRKNKKKFSWHRTPRSVFWKLRHSALSRKRRKRLRSSVRTHRIAPTKDNPLPDRSR